MNKKILLHFFLLLILSVKSFSQWNTNPAINTPVSVAAVDQVAERAVSDSKGGAIIAWEDFRASIPGGVADIYVQRIDKNGFVKWTANGVNICADPNDQGTIAITADGFGGAIISWNDHRSGKRDIYAQRIDSTGVIKWTANGVLSSGTGKMYDQRDSKLIADGSGGAIIVWQDSSVSNEWDVKAQRLSASNGSEMWTAGGVVICNTVLSQIRPRLRTDGVGGAIIVWQDKRNGVNSNIYAQRVNASGVVQWTANGNAIRSLSTYTAKNPILDSDGAGGAIIAWEDKRYDATHIADTTSDIYSQRVNASGTILWTANGVKVCNAPLLQSYLDMTAYGINGAVITWKDLRTDATGDVYAQKVDLATGAPQWTSNGISINATLSAQGAPSIIGDGSGNVIIAYEDVHGGIANDIYSVKINSTGVIQWTSAVSTADSSQSSPKIVSDGAGGCIYAFQDRRSGNDDIYAHHLYWNGTSDGISEQTLAISSKCFPNPFSSSAVIEINSLNIKGDIKFSVYNLIGEKVEVRFTVSQNRINISRGNLQSGIYFYEIKMNNNSVSKGKLILTK